MKKTLLYLVLFLVALSLIAPVATARWGWKWRCPKDKVKVMTRNLYIGSEIQSIASAGTEGEFLSLAEDALNNVALSNFPERAVALAAEIVEKKPHLVGLQEVYNITFNENNEFPPFRNYLNDLLDAIEAQGASYYVAAEVINLNLTIPFSPFLSVGVTDRDVILARYDVETEVVDLTALPENLFPAEKLSADGRNYQAVAGKDTPVGFIAFERGYVAVDASIGDFQLRFFNTHLEVRDPDPTNPLSPFVQRFQASELISLIGLLDLSQPHSGPVIVVGDINSSPEDLPILGIDPPYMQLSAVNFDTWTFRPGKPKLRPGKPKGYTCCQDGDLLNKKSVLYERIDVIFTSELPDKVKAKVVGNRRNDKTPSGLWPSDHAGVFTRIVFKD